MEPRPPRPRSSRPFETPASPETAGIGERLYPAPGEPVYAGAEPYPPGTVAEPSLLPRRQRRQRGALRAVAAGVVAIAAVAVLVWFFRDAVRGVVAPPPSPTAVAQQPIAATPTAAPEAAALPNALATVTPTASAGPTATSRPADTSLPANATQPAASSGDVQTVPLLDLLPTQAQVPAGLTLTDEAERSKSEVVESLGGTDEAAQLLDDWGWSGNAFRTYTGDGSGAPGGTTYLNVSVHRFADPASADNALTYFSDQVIFGQGLQEVEPPAIGEDARLLVGSPDGVPLSVLYAQQGPILYRIGASASNADGDPTVDVLSVAGAIIAGQSTGG
jgi:hypothetical protein